MLAVAAVCPHPPLLVPALAGTAVLDEPDELSELRAACDDAVEALVAAAPATVAVVGAGPEAGPAGRWHEDAGGTLAPYGVDVRAGAPGRAVLPLAATIGAWLLDRAGWGGRREYVAVPSAAPPPACAALGRELVAAESATALLVLGDGSARRSPAAPGALDPRAGAFDYAVATALAGADPAGLLALDVALAESLLVAGRAAWQVLAGAALAADAAWSARLLADSAPYGVGYFVALWQRRSRPGHRSGSPV